MPTHVLNPFVDFKYGDHYASDFHICRTIDGSRFNLNLIPSLTDKTTELSGADGTIFLNTFYKQRQFTINFAYDSLTDKDLCNLRAWLNTKEVHPLIFDEWPDRQYYSKVTGTPQLKYIPFDNIQFVDEPSNVEQDTYSKIGLRVSYTEESDYVKIIITADEPVYWYVNGGVQFTVQETEGSDTHIPFLTNSEEPVYVNGSSSEYAIVVANQVCRHHLDKSSTLELRYYDGKWQMWDKRYNNGSWTYNWRDTNAISDLISVRAYDQRTPATINTPPSSSAITFNYSSSTRRAAKNLSSLTTIYKGEGTIQLTCYDPFAYSLNAYGANTVVGGTWPTPFTVISTSALPINTTISVKIGNDVKHSITIKKATTGTFTWNSATGMVKDSTGPLPFTGNSIGLLQVGNTYNVTTGTLTYYNKYL